MSATTFERAAEFLGRALVPLADVTSDPALALRTLAQLGWQPPPGVDLAAALTVDVGALVEALTAVLESTDEERDDPEVMAPRYLELLAAIADVLAQVDDAAAALPQVLAGAGDYAEKTQIAQRLPRRLLDHLVFVSLTRAPQVVPASLTLLGVTRLERHLRDDAIYQTAHDRSVVEWEQLGRLLSDPGGALAQEYGWGTPTLASDRLLLNLASLLASVGAEPITIYGSATSGGQDGRPADVRLMLGRGPGIPAAALGIEARGTAPQGDPNDAGIEVVPYAGAGSVVLPLTDLVALRIDSDLTLSGGVALRVRPSGVGLESEQVAVTGGVAVSLRAGAPGGPPRDLLRAPGGIAIQLQEAFVEVGAASRPQQEPDVWVRLGLTGGRLTVTTDSGDGFLQQALPRELEAEFEARLRWSRREGLSLEGSGGLELAIPVQRPIGPILVDVVRIGLAGDEQGLALSAGVAATLSLGPMKATVEGLGIVGTLTPGDGNLGPVGVDIDFKPPEGAGLSVDAGAVTGGGYLSFDPEQEQYAGVLHLEIGQITLNAIGLLTTRLPDGSRGFSLLVIVQASGFAPVQLGFGFALTGVGGLLGINRTVAVDVLRAGVRTRALDSIMFMREDPVPRAPQIVSTLQSVFPPARGRFVFGPMVQLAWGTPALVTAEIALILELPAPLRLILIGRLRSVLPAPDAAIVKLQLDAVGVLDFDRREVSVDATLVDSTVGPFALSGDMALRASWGDRPDFALSIGGFHPAYTPPPGFPALRRLTLALSSGDNPRLRAETYLAITSNTVQLGAALELYVAAAGFALEGGMSFDALVVLSPFGFQVDIAAHLALKRGRKTLMGIDLRARLSGPNPWHVNGEVTFKVLFLKVTIRVDATFGDSRALPPAQREHVWPKLKEALESAGSWAAELPVDAGRLAVLRPPPPRGREAVVHPLGSVRVTQRVVPLERTVARFGAAPPADAAGGNVRFAIASATGAERDAAPLYESFSPGQFFALSNAEKLAAPGFEPMPAGARLRAPAGAQAVGATAPCPLSYETIAVGGPAAGGGRFAPDTATVAQHAEQGAAATAATRTTGRLKYALDEPAPRTADPAYQVAAVDTLTAEDVETDGSYSAALQAARERRDVQVVREEELVAP